MIKIVGIPALVGTYDNYIWILFDEHAAKAWVVDPGESQQVIDFLQQRNLDLAAILVTHRHFDHIDGIAALKQNFANCTVYGPELTPLNLIDKRLREGDQVTLSGDLSFQVLETPGHTEDHISYYNDHLLFCADTLFTGGCGRILGGTAEQFADSIIKLRNLNDDLLFYCAHEYTADNLAFAAYVDPGNPVLQQRLKETVINYPALHDGKVGTLGLEKQTNPFMRFDMEPLKSQLLAKGSTETPAQLFATLRTWKDHVDQGVENIN